MTKGSLVLREGLEIVAVAVVFIVCLGLWEGKNNNAHNADFGTGPPSFSQAGQPWEPLIAWHTRAGPLSPGPGAGPPAFSEQVCLGWKESFLLPGNCKNMHKKLVLRNAPRCSPPALSRAQKERKVMWHVASRCPPSASTVAVFWFLFCSFAWTDISSTCFISQGWNAKTESVKRFVFSILSKNTTSWASEGIKPGAAHPLVQPHLRILLNGFCKEFMWGLSKLL